MELLKIDKHLCTKCGICADACPASLISVDADGPYATGTRQCIACGHCVAVCPFGALDNKNAHLSEQTPFDSANLVDAASATTFLRSRRSIRAYKPEPVPRETISRILDVARFAPTGGNSQGLSYIVISDRGDLKRISATTVDWMEGEVKRGSPVAPYFEGIVRNARKTGKDVILRGAPHLIVAVCDTEFPRGAENAHFAFAYAELFAPTVGAGTCWAGLFQGCAFSGYGPLIEALKIPARKKVAGGLMVGFPRYRYYRLVNRNPLDVTWR
jgi:nitroreductase/NAD-dependent dihydropyrimidine dehydrogenase PreA subunit